MNKKLLASVMMLVSSVAYGMHVDYALVKQHIATLQAQYPTLYPVAKSNDVGIIIAYHSPLERKTRGLVARKDGTYERPFLFQDQPLEIFNPDLDMRGYKGFEDAWEKHVANEMFIKLVLDRPTNS